MEDKFIEMAERVAALEEFAKQSAEDRAEIKRSVMDVKQTANKTNADIHIIKEKLIRWESRFGAVIFVFGCVWAFFTSAGKAIVDWFKALGHIVTPGG